MAKIEKLSPIVAKWEAGFVNDPVDKGGATNMGITIGTWKQIGYDKDGDGDIDVQDIRLLDEHDFSAVLKIYWNRWQSNRIINQSVANLLVDWVFTSGSWGIKIPQRVLKLKEDGVVGNQTLTAVNLVDQKKLFNEVFEARKKFFHDVVRNNPEQKRFLKGWLNRLDDFKFSETDN
jgi:lysozyme family protein